ncbi:MAG: hypothetical protein PF505_09545, partial [Vallitaleaceae bacterium]|nr:hypothetical protein [Vallitaleaceae bacterium]
MLGYGKRKATSIILVLTLVAMMFNVSSNVAFAVDECVILDVYTDQASYATTDQVTISVEVNNPSTTVSKTVTTSVYHLDALVDTTSESVSMTGSAVTTYTYVWTPPATDLQGYLVKVDLGDGIYVTTAVDVSNDFTTYPRYGYSVDFPTGETSTESARMINNLAKDYHINVVQYYDWMFRHEQNFPTTGTTWDDLFGNTISEASIQNRIDAGHDVNQKAMAYQMAYMVREGYESYGVDKEWGLFRNKDYNISYNPSDISTISNIDQLNFPLEGEPGPILMITNPENPSWQSFMASQYTSAVDRLSFDGIQIDQMGDFWGSIDKFDYQGNYIDLGKTFSSFVNNAKDTLTTNNNAKDYVTMNIVNGAVPPNDDFSTWDIINNADTDFQFSELWQNSATYDSLQKYIEWQRLSDDGNKTMVLAAYMNQSDNAGTLYEAENATYSGLSSGTTDGTTYLTGYDTTGDYVNFAVTVPEDGTYTLVFRFANGASARADKNIYVDNTNVMTANFDPTRTNMIPALPSWTTYSYEAAFTNPKTLYLTAGSHDIKVQHDAGNTGDIRLDSLTLGTFNKASVRLTDAVIAASGAMHIEMGTGLSTANNEASNYSDSVMLGHPYYPKAFKEMRDDLRAEMMDHYDFITAYENLLFDGDVMPEDSGIQNLVITGENVTG